MPDLILIDGGRGQLNAALEALAELGVEETPVVGLAKREEEIYLPQRPEPLRLARNDAALQLLQQIRDEAHRFAVDRHRRRRSRRQLASGLEAVPGIGPRRRRKLLRRFGSLEGVRRGDARRPAGGAWGRSSASAFTGPWATAAAKTADPRPHAAAGQPGRRRDTARHIGRRRKTA